MNPASTKDDTKKRGQPKPEEPEVPREAEMAQMRDDLLTIEERLPYDVVRRMQLDTSNMIYVNNCIYDVDE